MPLPEFPKNEADRRIQWAKLPRRTRAAIRRLHNMLGHKPNKVLEQIMSGSKAPQEFVDAVKLFRCDDCALTTKAPRTHPVAAPSAYAFNHELHVDVFTLHDYLGKRHQFLSIVDCGTTFHLAIWVRDERKGRLTVIREMPTETYVTLGVMGWMAEDRYF